MAAVLVSGHAVIGRGVGGRVLAVVVQVAETIIYTERGQTKTSTTATPVDKAVQPSNPTPPKPTSPPGPDSTGLRK